MRRLLACAGLGLVASLFPLSSPASACDPNTFPHCQTYCGAVAYRYQEYRRMTDLNLPDWPHTGLAGCP